MSRSPSISAPASTESKSSRGSTRLAPTSFSKYSYNWPAATNGSSSISGSAVPVAASDQARNCSQSSGGAPINSAISRVGSGAAISSANSCTESGSTPSRMPRTISRIFGSSTEDAAPGEAGVDQLAHLPVPGRVGEDQAPGLHRARHRGVRDGDALGRGERGRAARDEPDVLVFQQRPEAGDVVPTHRRRRAQLAVRGIGVTGIEVRRMQWDGRAVRRAGFRMHPGLLDAHDRTSAYDLSGALCLLWRHQRCQYACC